MTYCCIRFSRAETGEDTLGENHGQDDGLDAAEEQEHVGLDGGIGLGVGEEEGHEVEGVEDGLVRSRGRRGGRTVRRN